jgi:hypothetical protein
VLVALFNATRQDRPRSRNVTHRTLPSRGMLAADLSSRRGAEGGWVGRGRGGGGRERGEG